MPLESAAGGGDEPGDQLLPCAGRGQREVEGLEQQEAEADGVAERDERVRVELLIDAAAGLGGLDDVRQAGPPIVDPPAQQVRHVRIAPGGDERLEEQRLRRIGIPLDEL